MNVSYTCIPDCQNQIFQVVYLKTDTIWYLVAKPSAIWQKWPPHFGLNCKYNLIKDKQQKLMWIDLSWMVACLPTSQPAWWVFDKSLNAEGQFWLCCLVEKMHYCALV